MFRERIIRGEHYKFTRHAEVHEQNAPSLKVGFLQPGPRVRSPTVREGNIRFELDQNELASAANGADTRAFDSLIELGWFERSNQLRKCYLAGHYRATGQCLSQRMHNVLDLRQLRHVRKFGFRPD